MTHKGHEHDGDEAVVDAAEEGDALTVGARIIGVSNPAWTIYGVEEYPVFVHRDRETGEDVLLLDADWSVDAPESDVERARALVEGLPLDLSHHGIDYIRERDADA